MLLLLFCETSISFDNPRLNEESENGLLVNGINAGEIKGENH